MISKTSYGQLLITLLSHTHNNTIQITPAMLFFSILCHQLFQIEPLIFNSSLILVRSLMEPSKFKCYNTLILSCIFNT